MSCKGVVKVKSKELEVEDDDLDFEFATHAEVSYRFLLSLYPLRISLA